MSDASWRNLFCPNYLVLNRLLGMEGTDWPLFAVNAKQNIYLCNLVSNIEVAIFFVHTFFLLGCSGLNSKFMHCLFYLLFQRLYLAKLRHYVL